MVSSDEAIDTKKVEIDFRPTEPELPRWPDEITVDAETSASWSARLHSFHFQPRVDSQVTEAESAELAPAALIALDQLGDPRHPFLTLIDEHGALTGKGLAQLFAELPQGAISPAMQQYLPRLIDLVSQRLADGRCGQPLADLVDWAVTELGSRLGLDTAELELLDRDRRALEAGVASRPVYDLSQSTAIRLIHELAKTVIVPGRNRAKEHVAQLASLLQERLQIETDEVSDLAGLDDELFNTAAIGRPASASQALEPERKARMEVILQVLQSWLVSSDPPSAVLVHDPDLEIPTILGTESLRATRPLAVVERIWRDAADEIVKLSRAIRSAELELSDRWQERHEELLANLSWESLDLDELHLVPQVVAITTGAELRATDLSLLSRLLRTSLPVTVLVLDELGNFDEANALDRYHCDLGTIVLAHRESAIVQTAFADPAPAIATLSAIIGQPRPKVILTHRPDLEASRLHPLSVQGALYGRAVLALRYDPEAGDSWIDRLDLSSMPQNERIWPELYLEVGSEDGAERHRLELTFADSVAIEPFYRNHLLLIPREAWSDEQRPLADFLRNFDLEDRSPGLPFIWVVAEDGELQRAIISRELTLACRDRQRGWQALREMAGIGSAAVERAVAATQLEAQAESKRQIAEAEASHEAQLEAVRDSTARTTLEQLASALLSTEGLATAAPLAARPAALPTTEAATPAASVEPEEAEAPSPEVEEDDDDLISADPYIDSILCTTCNECLNLNGMLFAYNGDKQAEIKDSAAGTFEDLVKAAELCPAKCIHPGAPRPDDATATPALIERAAVFS